MTQTVLETKRLTKLYNGIPAVDDVSMHIKKGDIYGLIGRNGAGKTTLIRMITALTYPTGGEISMFGQNNPKGLINARQRIGCIVEAPAFYSGMTAYQNLEYYRIFRGIPDKGIIEKTLKMVNLSDTGKKKYKDFSLGMKQRLGLALALLNSPDFILLDEPINGLDPIAIVEMRETLKSLSTEHGITILISSHILTELSLIATRYGIIHKGRLIKELTDGELHDACQKCLSIVVNDPIKAVSVLETVLKTDKYKVLPSGEIKLFDYLKNPSEVSFQLNRADVRVNSIKESGLNLEDYFISIIGEGKKNA